MLQMLLYFCTPYSDRSSSRIGIHWYLFFVAGAAETPEEVCTAEWSQHHPIAGAGAQPTAAYGAPSSGPGRCTAAYGAPCRGPGRCTAASRPTSCDKEKSSACERQFMVRTHYKNTVQYRSKHDVCKTSKHWKCLSSHVGTQISTFPSGTMPQDSPGI